jgi:hypothetical protein
VKNTIHFRLSIYKTESYERGLSMRPGRDVNQSETFSSYRRQAGCGSSTGDLPPRGASLLPDAPRRLAIGSIEFWRAVERGFRWTTNFRMSLIEALCARTRDLICEPFPYPD